MQLQVQRHHGLLRARFQPVDLAARGQLDAEGLGRDIAELAGLRRLKPKRVVAALQEAARTGAYATVWAVLSRAPSPGFWRENRHPPAALCSRSRPTARNGPGPVARYVVTVWSPGLHSGVPDAALHRIVVTRMRQDERTRLYLERRTAQGKGNARSCAA